MHNVFGDLNKKNVLMIFIETGTVPNVSIYTVAKQSVEFRVSHVMIDKSRAEQIVQQSSIVSTGYLTALSMVCKMFSFLNVG